MVYVDSSFTMTRKDMRRTTCKKKLIEKRGQKGGILIISLLIWSSCKRSCCKWQYVFMSHGLSSPLIWFQFPCDMKECICARPSCKYIGEVQAQVHPGHANSYYSWIYCYSLKTVSVVGRVRSNSNQLLASSADSQTRIPGVALSGPQWY